MDVLWRIWHFLDDAQANPWRCVAATSLLRAMLVVRGSELQGSSMAFTDQNTVFRESVLLGTTTLSSREVEQIIGEMRDDYPASSYNVLTKYAAWRGAVRW